jgi:molybdenum cofactor synthesis domain-containing protein
VLSRVPSPRPVTVAIADALGLVLSEPVVAVDPIPPFDNTSVDGFALRSSDVIAVPARLRLVGEVRAGQAILPTVGEGETVRIMTGAPIPPGADAVVMVEETSTDGDWVLVSTSVSAGDAIRLRGDSVAAGQVVLEAGTRLRAPHLGVLAELGVVDVPVYARLRVGVISTGDELVADGAPLGPGQIRESNGALLVGLLTEAGCVVVDYGIVPDEESALEAVLRRGVAECDALVTSGGVSMGEYDLVKVLLDALGEMEWMQVAIKPAKPFAFGLLGAPDRVVPVFGLPGNPVSSFVSFEVLARPALRKMMGVEPPGRPVVRAIADAAIARHPGDGKQHLVRVVGTFAPDGRLHVAPTGAQGSHQLAASAAANGLAVVEDGAGVAVASEVAVLYLG